MPTEAIGRIDFLNGPYAAAYPGNSIGGVLLITSKMPDHAFATVKETASIQPWNQYGTRDIYPSSNTSAAAGNRDGALSWLVSANYQDTFQQPLTYTTNRSPPPTPTGLFRRSTSRASLPTSSAPVIWRIPSKPPPICGSPTTSRRWCRRPIRWGLEQRSDLDLQTYDLDNHRRADFR